MPALWNPQANAIFLQALEQPPAERESYLREACDEDASLEEQVRALLTASERAGSFLESPPTEVISATEIARERAAEPAELDFLSPSERTDAIGRLGHYEVLAVVGSGGFGMVLKAFDEQLHRIVAIKALSQSLAASATARKRFVREARAAAAINHENVVDIHAVEESGPAPYLVMEYVGGVSLDAKLKESGSLGVKEILRIGLQIASGLAAAHKHGLVHRDVKPANILLENGVERVKVTDFGLARSVDDVALTQTGIIAGTPSYMSPEQAHGEPVDHRSDLFSLGSVLYAMCTGRSPFRAETTMATLRRVCDERPRPIREVNPDIPDWLVTIIDRLLAKQPADRFQSAAEVADLLGQHLAQLQDPGRTGGASPLRIEAPQGTNVPRSPGRRWPLLATAAAILLLVGVSLTEATGVTHFAPTLMRIVTGEGTLLVEVNDPAVKVTVEGDGDLVITGAGLHEVHLKPGKYQLKADKNGQPVPLDQELVTITRSGKEVVRVRLEATPAVVAADASLTPTAEGFTSLFNGKDLTGWAAAEGGTGMWKIEDGALTCTGPRDHLLTTRNDFGDFHLRAEVKINANGNSGIYFRTGKPLVLIGDYEAQITDNPGQGYKTGSLYGLVRVSESPVPPNTWFTYEIIAVGKRIRILVNGKQTADYTEDRAGRNTQGHISLQHHDPESRVFFRKVEIKELPAAKSAAEGAFIILGGNGVAERKFDTLAEAVQGASDGDTIEIRGNGPFVSQPISVGTNALTLRAGEGFRPLLNPSPNCPVLMTEAPLVVEGIDFEVEGAKSHISDVPLINSRNARLYIANCRFLYQRYGFCVVADNSPLCVVRNCQFVGPKGSLGVHWSNMPVVGKSIMDNSVIIGTHALWGSNRSRDVKDVAIQLTSNTIVGAMNPITGVALFVEPDLSKAPVPPMHMEASGNIFDGNSVFALDQHPEDNKQPLQGAEAEAYLARLLDWRDQRNLYAPGTSSFAWFENFKPVPAHGPASLAEWIQFWRQPNSESVEGPIRYQGNPRSKLSMAPEKIGPEDFRLRPDSAGYRAGKDGKDLGADVDLVGPGPAYERWKKTPEYQQWLEETGQLTKVAGPQSEPNAFVLLGAKGAFERKFATLAEAVRGASDGDTIEIRGNGPFVTEPIDLKNQSLIIRAADGYRPVLKQTAEAVEKCLPLLETSAPLVLEGLELQQVSQTNRAGGLRSMLISRDAPLWLANCRLFMKDQQQICVSARYCPTVELHNCEFFTNGHGLLWLVDKSSKCLVSNCVQAGGNTFGVVSDRPGAREALVRLERNTLATSSWLVHLSVGGGSSPKHWGLAPEDKLVRIKAADNILDANSALTFAQWPETPSQEQWSAIKGQEAETEFQKMIQWDDGRNVFTPGASSISWLISGGFDAPHGPKSLASWKKFWGNLNADAFEGQMRYQGGNLSALLAAGPDKLTAEHFRLRPDSAGYRAGKDGKDLGADVDLVGPGPAYERWKMTPEYQQWLKDTKQVTKTESATPETEVAARELAKWQGEWENADYGRLVIDGERWSSHPKNGFEVVSTIKIVEVTDEMTHILLLSAGVDGKVRTIQTILRVDGDTLHNCGTFGSVRPTEFANKPGCIYTQWKRVSNPPP